MNVSSRTLYLIGFALATMGSGLGLLGALMQANAYYPFKVRKFVGHIYLVFRKALREGPEAALNEVRVATALAPGKQEDRAKSLFGLYLVFCGFFVNVLGALLALMGSIIDSPAAK
jgi:hypothetical protein